MKSHARAVILGGGIHGVSTLYNLAREGWTDVVLIEKGELTSGTTWHAAGQCPHFNGSLNFAKICDEGIKLYRSLEQETGQATGWHQAGGIRLARHHDELDWHKNVVGIAKQAGVEAYIVGLDEIRSLHPFLELHDVVGGTYTPNDGHVDPTSATNALAIAARKLGATIYKHTRATDIQKSGDEWTIITDKGNITCEHLVIAAGFFTTKVGDWLGLKVPLVNVVHQYLVTDPVDELRDRPGELPVVRDPGSSSYMRQEQKGLLGGPYETAGIRLHTNDVPWSFDMDLLEPDLDHIAPWLEQMMERMPLFGTVGVRKVISGFIAHTPDLVPLVGPAPGLKNVWLNCGSTTGIAQGPGCSKYLAQWMVHGAADISMTSLDPRRFGEVHSGDWVRERTIEASSSMYDIHPPGYFYETGRPVRVTPIYEDLKAKGGVFGESMGWERVKYFANGENEHLSYSRNSSFPLVAEECQAVRERIGVLDLSSFSKFEVKGPDAATFLDRIFANRVPKKSGDIALCHLLTVDGLIDAEITVTRLDDELFYLTSAGSMQVRDRDMLNAAKRSDEKVEIKDVTADYGVLVVSGPKTRDVLKMMTEADLSSASFPWLKARTISIENVAVRALRLSYAGELGWELHVPISSLRDIYLSLIKNGTPYGIKDFGMYALNSLRMEKAYRGFGSELTNEVSLVEADMDRFYSLQKTDFIGKEGIEKRLEAGPKIKLAYVEVDAPHLDIIGQEPVYDGDRIIGSVTSGGFGHAIGKNLAFLYVYPEYASPGSSFEIEMLGHRYPARVIDQPAYDPKNERMRV
jgi:dimethylglycine dehydrogenase